LIVLSACDVLTDISDRSEVTQTPAEFRTATPGGMISVWLVTPTGGPVALISTSSSESRGEVIGPAATGTAVVAALQAATQTAAAPIILQTFQPDKCPVLTGRVPEPRPPTFAQFPAAIGTYLSQGGPPSVLESELQVWGAITNKGGTVQSNTDLTGDKIPEILVNIFDPYIYNPDAVRNAGRLLVYGCDNGAYRLIYSTPSSPELAIPVLHRVGDMNGDVKAELVYDVQSCTISACVREGQILTWDPLTGSFDALNSSSIIAVNGRLGVVDFDGDGILEVTASNTPSGDVASGPRRTTVDFWDWAGSGSYLLAQSQSDDPLYMIHVVHDADEAVANRNWNRAISLYLQVRDSRSLLTWVQPNEREILKAYVTYRLIVVYARVSNTRNVQNITGSIATENPDGSAGVVYRDMAQAFTNDFLTNSNLTTACQAALQVASTRPESLALLNSYGYANRTYSLTDLCPF
jgi:hypothetical protein